MNVQLNPMSQVANVSNINQIQRNNDAIHMSKNFNAMLTQSLNSVATQKNEVEHLTNQFITGQLSDVHQLKISSEKALLGLQLTVQVRDKAVEAYREVMRMQI
ncbi:flagellar hook-basal body complex protein FliE [Longirhabdus pacifica]|uniref:flagellar hook-basal body complex protein FliE n=1 Tax=Longirhabdus pacifica TaxID=2305227 RepID=UPI001F0B932B|nr:flagellar hook-basal body complex protein FliE [Longirhabdus pacifica]